jgi:hypothetical protein
VRIDQQHQIWASAIVGDLLRDRRFQPLSTSSQRCSTARRGHPAALTIAHGVPK